MAGAAHVGRATLLLGAVAVSAQPQRFVGIEERLTTRLRQVASRVGAGLRGPSITVG